MSELLDALLGDLAAEGDRLRETVDRLGPEGWERPTPAPGWTVATQVAHLLWTDEVAALAARSHESAEAEERWDAVVLAAVDDPTGYVDRCAFEVAGLPREQVLERWTAARGTLRSALVDLPPGQRMPWFGPPMSAASMATARFMETWAHAHDVHDAAGEAPAPTDRIRHVAHLGVRTRDFAYAVHGEEPPAEEFRVELTAPSGRLWTWGEEDARQRVTGPAHDFCLLVTQRIHRDDTALRTVGEDAEHWLGIAQAFAGPPGAGREVRA